MTSRAKQEIWRLAFPIPERSQDVHDCLSQASCDAVESCHESETLERKRLRRIGCTSQLRGGGLSDELAHGAQRNDGHRSGSRTLHRSLAASDARREASNHRSAEPL